MSKKSSSAGISEFDEAKWRAENDMRTLAQAVEIRKDPKRLTAAKKCAEEKLAEMKAITGETVTK
ncbi:MAG TPA: hypothetical protein VGE36_13715 [Roseateles sp.]